MYIVTGATGFIGSCLLAEMEKRGFRDIVAVDTFGDGAKWRNVAKRGAL
ncbi:MAG: NAD-dependent epimerase/dehydratase family protein, partial [Bacteroidales bacterium]|nr:NAD-dependent epimerase/dehydratase family protein [Bacteroidales bacterium]